MSEKEQLSAMLQELHARCPTLCPAVVPAGCDDRESGTAMLALSRDAQERQALVSLLSSARRAATHCALTDRETPEQDLRFVAFWQLNAARATYRLTRCAFVCTEGGMIFLHPICMTCRHLRATRKARTPPVDGTRRLTEPLQRQHLHACP